MKTGYRLLLLVATVTLIASCRSRADEKRIADLESRLAEVEKKSGGATTPVTTPNTTPTDAPTPAETKPEGPIAKATFATLDHDFGTVNEGEKVKFKYMLTNTGDAPLIIQTAQPSCGCTVPSWTKDPIAVGGTGFVEAEFDTKGKAGIQNKTITVTANTWPKITQLKFKAMVTAAPTGANGPSK